MEHGVNVEMPWGMNNKYLEKALHYGTHSLALKEKTFV